MQEVKEMFHTIRGIDYVRRVGGDVRKRREVRARQEEKIVERKRKEGRGRQRRESPEWREQHFRRCWALGGAAPCASHTVTS